MSALAATTPVRAYAKPYVKPCRRRVVSAAYREACRLSTGCCGCGSGRSASEDTTSCCSTSGRQQDTPCGTGASSAEWPGQHMLVLLAAAAPLLQVTAAAATPEADQAYSAAAIASYQPSPYTPGWEVWFGAVVATIPFVLGAWEFGKRIIIQRRCVVCDGRGLVMKGKFPKKCPECGGFFPWVSWRYFFLSTATPGNGGPLLQPKGQTSIFYKVPPGPDAARSTEQDGAEEPQKPAGSDRD